MTEFAIVKAGASIASVGGLVAVMAVIDPSVTSIALAIIAGAVVIIPLWFKHRTDMMNARLKEADARLREHDVKIAEVIKTSDGMKEALVAATAKAERAEGVLEGVSQAETKAAIVNAATAAGEAKSDAKKPA